MTLSSALKPQLRLRVRAAALLGAALSVSSGGCGSEEEAAGGEARLTTRGAGELLSSAASETRVPPALRELGTPTPETPSGQDLHLDLFGVDFGSRDAPARIIELFDFGCGFCRKFHEETLPALTDKYIDPGQVLWKAVPFVIGNWASSVPATLAAECALGQSRDAYVAMAGTLFRRQADWKSAAEPERVIEEIATDVGLDIERYRTCMSSDEFLWRVQAHTALARQIGVRGTPTFVAVGYAPFAGALPLELFEEIIDTVLVRAAAVAAP